MNRRKFLATTGAIASVGLSGCITQDKTGGNFELTDIGLIKRENEIAAFVEARNISETKRVFHGYLAVYAENGARVSNWEGTTTGKDSPVKPGNKIRVYTVYDSSENGWYDPNNLGQIVDSHSTKYRLAKTTAFSQTVLEPRGDPFNQNNIGDILEE